MSYDRYEIKKEIERLGIKNDPMPEVCDECQVLLEMGGGMVGERVLYCKEHGIKWEDNEDAIRRIY